MGDQWLKKQTAKGITFFKIFTDFENEQKCICILTQAYIKCAFLRDKVYHY